MGCSYSFLPERKVKFGANGLVVGRNGDVDLTSRSMDVFGTKLVHSIQCDKLHTARSLHLSDNKLYSLGKEMQLLFGIEELYINNNRFERLPKVLAQMSRLRFIDASNNPLDKNTHSLNVLPQVSNLTHLVLRDCCLTGVIPQCLLECVMLNELDLSGNLLRFEEVSFATLVELRILRVANCGIKNEIPSCIKELRTLETLDISTNLFNFECEKFFGDYLVNSLTSLHLRSMQLVAVPQVIISLRKLTFIDLAENPLETVAVLAGRLVRKLAARSLPFAPPTSNNNNNINNNNNSNSNNDTMSVVSHNSTHMSFSQLGRVGCIAHVQQPIPLQKISLRACGFQRLPKYFHKLYNLIDIDLSENYLLDDPNMKLFSFSNLQVLNILGCQFVESQRLVRNEWFDIARLRKLHTITWDTWKCRHNTNPYHTKIPLELCGLRLKEINGVKLRPGLFVGDIINTIINVMRDGYYNIDLALGDDVVKSYVKAVKSLMRLESFFFTNKVKGEEQICDDNNKNNKNNNDDDRQRKNGVILESEAALFDRSIRLDVLKIVVNRYIFFLTMQAANYNTLIIPPADVMALHYAQLTHDPISYRIDCNAICKKVLGCNYFLFFFDSDDEEKDGEEEKEKKDVKKEDVLENSKSMWNATVRTAQQGCGWLNYDFWEYSLKENLANVNNDNNSDNNNNNNYLEIAELLPAVPVGNDSIFSNLEEVNSGKDLSGVLDVNILKHFTEQGVERYCNSLKIFFITGKRLLTSKEFLEEKIFWKPYVKYLALYAYIYRMEKTGDYNEKNIYNNINKQEEEDDYEEDDESPFLQNNSFVSPSFYLPLPVKQETFLTLEPQLNINHVNCLLDSNNNNNKNNKNGISTAMMIMGGNNKIQSAVEFKNSTILRNNEIKETPQNCKKFKLFKPVPTQNILILLYAHRIVHIKYYQTLELLGIADVDIEWEESQLSLEATIQSWIEIYKERYVKNLTHAFPMYNWQNFSIPQFKEEGELFKGAVVGAFKRVKRNQRHVTFCSVNTE